MPTTPISIRPMLARSADSLPRGDRWVYEPKWDGFRALVEVNDAGVRIAGRNGGSLDHLFRDVRMVAAQLPPGSVLDGEIVVMRDGVLDFAALMKRASQRPPATLVAFDIVRFDGRDTRPLPLRERRRLLEEVVPQGDRLCVTAQTDDEELAERWFVELAPRGLEGVVAKLAGDPYRGGRRGWVKVRRFETLDAVVGGYRSDGSGATSLLLGLYAPDGGLRYIGQTASLPERDRRPTARVLAALSSERSFSGGVMPGMGRWENARFEDWVPVEPVLVCEVACARIDHGFLRHPARVVRWRPDKDARDCTVER